MVPVCVTWSCRCSISKLSDLIPSMSESAMRIMFSSDGQSILGIPSVLVVRVARAAAGRDWRSSTPSPKGSSASTSVPGAPRWNTVTVRVFKSNAMRSISGTLPKAIRIKFSSDGQSILDTNKSVSKVTGAEVGSGVMVMYFRVESAQVKRSSSFNVKHCKHRLLARCQSVDNPAIGNQAALAGGQETSESVLQEEQIGNLLFHYGKMVLGQRSHRTAVAILLVGKR